MASADGNWALTTVAAAALAAAALYAAHAAYDWSDERIAANMEQLCGADVEAFVRTHRPDAAG